MKILVVGPSWVGDMVMAQSLFKTLQQVHRDCRIHVLAPDWSRPLIERMPEVEKAIALPFGHGVVEMKERRDFALGLRHEYYDQAIVLPNSLKSALIPFWAQVPVRTGWRGEMRYVLLNDLRVLDKLNYPLMVQRFDALAYSENAVLPDPLPRPALKVDPENSKLAVAKFMLDVRVKPVLALCPGAEFGTSKRWPPQHFSDLAKQRLTQGWQVWLFGSRNDRAVTDAIVAELPQALQSQCHNLAGDTSLAEAIDLLSLATAVVSNDSGLMHIAAALDRPLVAVYGSTSPAFTPPLATRVRIETANLSCSPCFKRECPLGHGNCMKQLGVSQVEQALTSVTAAGMASGMDS